MPEVVLYSKPGCCLCDELKQQLTRLQKRHRFEWSEINILDHPDAFERFQHEIPVVFVRGREAFRHHLDEKQLLKLLRQPSTGNS